MTTSDSPDAPQPSRAVAEPKRRRPRWWVTLATFVAGILVGVLAVGLLSVGTPDFVTAADRDAAANPPPSGGGTVAVAAQARVNAACLRVINEGQDTYTVLTGLDEAVTDVDLQRLDDIVRRLQPIQPRLQRDLADCEVDVSTGPGSEPAGSASAPAPSPTPTR